MEIATALYREHGFRGHIGWHYYNEPLMAAERMWRLMDRIDAAVPEATYTLWTNGTLLPEDSSPFNRFKEVYITNYERAGQGAQRLMAAKPATIFQRGHLDDRLHAIGDCEAAGPACNRMFTEFIVDYYGNVHLCCYDWQGLGTIGNVQRQISSASLGFIIQKWQFVRGLISGSRISRDAPPTCVCCKVRSEHIPQFIPQIAADARRSLEESCQK